MRTINSNPTIYAFISIASHMLLILAMALYFDFSVPVPILGDSQEKIVNSFLYKDNPVKQMLTSKTKVVATKENKQPQPVVEKVAQHAIVIAKKMQAAMKQVMAESSSKGVQTNELLALLHAAIQQQQHYPPSAMQLERQGRVTVSFTLLKSGVVTGLHIVKSSGTESLDNAALAAVNAAAPFQHLDQYLTAPREFNIDVVFELA